MSRRRAGPRVVSRRLSRHVRTGLRPTRVSTAFSGGISEVIKDFHVSSEVAILGVSLFVVGFAIGPFQDVDLWSGYRSEEADEKLGTSAVKIHGYCLPGREEEVHNACAPLADAADEFVMKYGRYPYDSYKLCFVEDMVSDTVPLQSFSLCSAAPADRTPSTPMPPCHGVRPAASHDQRPPPTRGAIED